MTSRTPPPVTLDGGLLAIGRQGLAALREALAETAGDDLAPAFQTAGYAAGDQVYDQFRHWTRAWTGVDDPADLDASTLSECLGAFFAGLGWGPLTAEPQGRAGLALTSPDWAEAQDGGSPMPTCFFTAGMLAAVLGHLADRDVAVMEVECRSRGDQACRFLAGSPEALTRAYEAMASGQPWKQALE